MIFFVKNGPNLPKNNQKLWDYKDNRTNMTLDDINRNLEEVMKLCNDSTI